jgi:transcriptional regulator with XRE-family HTH domain
VDTSFLRNVQNAGWIIQFVDDDKVLAKCPRAGCSLKAVLKDGDNVPETCAVGPSLTEITIGCYDDARKFLRQRRDDLVLSIKDVEEVAGMTVDMLAKVEKDNPSKIPNFIFVLEWAQSLGYDLVLRPGNLPNYALRTIAESRGQMKRRLTTQPFHHSRRV